jgi:hypothetical protein
MEHLQIEQAKGLPTWTFHSPYLAVLWISEGVTDQWQQKISEWLIDTGCLYMLVWQGGVGGHDWIDSLNESGKKAVAVRNVAELHSVVSACYEYVALREVLNFAEREAVHPTAGRLPPILLMVKN